MGFGVFSCSQCLLFQCCYAVPLWHTPCSRVFPQHHPMVSSLLEQSLGTSAPRLSYYIRISVLGHPSPLNESYPAGIIMWEEWLCGRSTPWSSAFSLVLCFLLVAPSLRCKQCFTIIYQTSVTMCYQTSQLCSCFLVLAPTS